jgi:hypothetical protein
MPAARREATEERRTGGLRIRVEGLRVVAFGELDDLFGAHPPVTAAKARAGAQVLQMEFLECVGVGHGGDPLRFNAGMLGTGRTRTKMAA